MFYNTQNNFLRTPNTNILTIPNVIEGTSRGERAYDILSKLLDDRIIMLCDEVNDDSAALIVAELLYLQSKDREKDIYLYINSPGGSVTAVLVWLHLWVHFFFLLGQRESVLFYQMLK